MIKYLRTFQVTKPYVTFILSLLISDSFTALLLGIQLLFGAYLPVVHKIHLHGCIMTVSEAFKLAGVLVTVYHLLVMVTMHLLGVTAPISFKKVRVKLLFYLQKATQIQIFNEFLVPKKASI